MPEVVTLNLKGFRSKLPTKSLLLISMPSLTSFYCCAHVGCGIWRLGGS